MARRSATTLDSEQTSSGLRGRVLAFDELFEQRHRGFGSGSDAISSRIVSPPLVRARRRGEWTSGFGWIAA